MRCSVHVKWILSNTNSKWHLADIYATYGTVRV